MTLASERNSVFSRVRILVTDVDGTLLDSSGRLTRECAAAVEKFRGQGGGIILATGKLYGAIENLVHLLNLELPQIVCDGGAIVHPATREVAPIAPMSNADVEGVCSLLRRRKIEFVVYSATEIAAGEGCVARENIAKLENIGESNIIAVNVAEYIRGQGPVLKILSFVESGALEKDAIALLRGQFPELRSVRTSPYFLEFSSRGSGKLAALERISSICGFRLSEVAAIGDNDNDAEVILEAGLGGAVAGASVKARDAASVLVPGNDENGFAAFVEYVLGDCA